MLRKFLPLVLLLSSGCAHGAMANQETAPSPAATQTAASPYLSLSELRAKYEDSESRYVTVGGLKLHYKDEGKGPVILMLHGSQSSLRTYDRITQLMKSEYRIIRLDLPGYGLSDAVTEESVANSQPVEMVEGVVDHLGLTKLTAVGVSSGGTMSAFLAAKRPELVERLVLSNMPSDPYNTAHLVMPQSFLDAQKRFAETKVYDRNFWYEYLRYFAGDPARMTDEKIDEYTDFGRRAPDPNLLGLVARVGDGVAAQAKFGTITAPTLLIWGSADPLLPESASAALVGHLKRTPASRMLLSDVGHYPPLEAPDRFAYILKTYIEAATPAP